MLKASKIWLSTRKHEELQKKSSKLPSLSQKKRCYSLTDQVRRSSRSIGAQIAEAWGKRRYEKHFISKLTDADSEQLETQHWIEVAEDCNYVVHAQVLQIINKLSEIGRMLNSMMKKAKQFCGERPDH